MISVAAFYRFIFVDDCAALRASLLHKAGQCGLKGTLLIAPEGINATLAGRAEQLDDFLAYLQADPRFAALSIKRSECATMPFQRLKIRLKKEIIPLGFSLLSPTKNMQLSSPEWNALIACEDVLLIDTRNDYEVAHGSFKGAHNPAVRHFSDMLAFTDQKLAEAKQKKIAIYCTGGIRCEKYAAYLASEGFEEVYQLEGGILRYLAETSEAENKFHGACYVFDARIVLNAHLESAHA